MTYRLIRLADLSEQLPHELGVTKYIWQYKNRLLCDTVTGRSLLVMKTLLSVYSRKSCRTAVCVTKETFKSDHACAITVIYAIFEILTAVLLNTEVFWLVVD